jgi:pyruvate dehydrogenase E1 component alpha subunit
MVAALHATDEGGAISSSCSTQGERVPEQRSAYAADIGVTTFRPLRDMVLVRRFDREANALQRQGQLGIWVPLLGREAAQIRAALAPQDMAFPSYREHGVAWCRGIDPTELLGIFRGTDNGSWDSKATRFHLYTIVIGNQCLNATGYAMGQKFESKVGEGPDAEATMCFFGDGATSQGDVHEGFVWAASPRPSSSTARTTSGPSEPTERQTRVPLYKRAQGYGFPGIRVDGATCSFAVSRWALDECRTGSGPVLVEAFTPDGRAHRPTTHPLPPRRQAGVWKLKDDRTGAGAPRPVIGVSRSSSTDRGRRRRARRAVPAVLHGHARACAGRMFSRSTRGRRWWPRSAGFPRYHVVRGRDMATLTLARR